MVDKVALREMNKLVIDTIHEHGWILDDISHEHITQEIVVNGGEDAHMLDCALRSLGGKKVDDKWHLETSAVVREVAKGVLRKRVSESGGNPRMPLDDFKIEWTMGIPGSLTCPPLHVLDGIVLREDEPDAKIAPEVGQSVSYPCVLFLNLEDMPANNCEVTIETSH